MASLLSSTRQVKERVRTYAPNAAAELVQEANTLSQSLREEVARASSAPQGSNRAPWYDFGAHDPEGGTDTLTQRIRAQRAVREAELAEREGAFKSAMQKRQQELTRKKDAEFASMYGDVLAGLSNDNGIMGETAYALEHSAKVKSKKQEALHQEWETQVFDRIQGRLQASVDARDPRDVMTRLKSQYDQYLHTTNTKSGVFRDVIIEDDYNPLSAHEATIRIATGDIRDPLKRDVLKGEYERQLMGSSIVRQSLGKVTLSPTSWGEQAITATPYGHCVDRSGDYVVRPPSGKALQARQSHIPLDHYDYPVGNEHAAAEMPKGKLIVPGPEQRRGRPDLFDVVQHTCHLKPSGYTGGDQWLEARGKAIPEGPEARRGRKGLTEVMQQKSSADEDGRAVGDMWLEARGKARVAGPDARSGRNGLFETIQQKGNPYQDGRTLDDSWLEYKGRRVLPSIDNNLATVLSGRPPAAKPRTPRPNDLQKYGTHITAAGGTITVRDTKVLAGAGLRGS